MADLTRELQSYRRLTSALDEEFADPDVLVTLGLREEIERAHHLLTPEQREELASCDALLAGKWQIVAEMLPSPGRNDRSHWWWFLHEGPQVREQAQEIARS